jgi:hypothetical protein
MSAQTVSTCVVCGAQTDAFLCGDARRETGCLGRLLRGLGDCAALVDELNTTISRQDKLGSASVGFISSGGGERPLPVNIGAMDSGLLLRDRLSSWARMLWEDNAPRDEDGSPGPINVQPGIVSVSRWLMRHPTWIALCPAVDELYDEVMETMRLAWRSVDTAPGKVYVGQCSTVLDDWWMGEHEDRPEGPSPMCTEELYALEGDWEKRCPVCSTIHDVTDRKEVLNGAVEHQYVPEEILLSIANGRGENVTRPMLRSLRRRKRIGTFINVRDGDIGAGVVDPFGFRIRLWTEKDHPTLRLYRVGQVLEAVTNKWARQAA